MKKMKRDIYSYFMMIRRAVEIPSLDKKRTRATWVAGLDKKRTRATMSSS